MDDRSSLNSMIEFFSIQATFVPCLINYFPKQLVGKQTMDG
jgi:hypothetical protein